jgi:hypothetical protein
MSRSAPISLTAAIAALAVAAASGGLCAQDFGVAIEPLRLPQTDSRIVGQATELKNAHKLMSDKQVAAGLISPKPAALTLPAPSTKILPPREVALRAKKALLRIGWFYLCPKCSRWHVNLAGGYVITADGAAVTCYHCVNPKGIVMREGYLVAMDSDGTMLPVTAVLARDPVMDAAIVRVSGKSFTPLALNDRVAPGDPVYLYSDPMRVAGYFSTGMVNRFFWRTGGRHGDPNTLGGARAFRMHVSTDWAPGSSGAPVVDACGNVVGHVAVISSLQQKPSTPQPAPRTPKAGKDGNSGDDSKDGKDDEHGQAPIAPPSGGGATMMTLHEAVPARAVRLLAENREQTPGSEEKNRK